MSISETAEKIEKANIQGFGIDPVKINNPMVRCQPHQKVGIKIWEEKPPHQATLRRTAMKSAR